MNEACPKCGGGPYWDNRADKANGVRSPKWPDFKCAACKHAIWLPIKVAPPTASAPLPDVCPGCQEGPEWWPLVADREAKGIRTQTVIRRYLIRHKDDMACGRFNGVHRWYEADPEPGRETGIGLG